MQKKDEERQSNCRVKEERAELTLLVSDVIHLSGRRDNTKNGGMTFRIMNKIEKPLGRGAAKRGELLVVLGVLDRYAILGYYGIRIYPEQ